MNNYIENVFNGLDPNIDIKEVNFKVIKSTMYFFVERNIEETKDLLTRLSSLCLSLNNSEVPGVGHWTFNANKFNGKLKALPESYYDDGYTEFEAELLYNSNARKIECGRLIKNNGSFDEIIYIINDKLYVDRNGYELIFD